MGCELKDDDCMGWAGGCPGASPGRVTVPIFSRRRTQRKSGLNTTTSLFSTPRQPAAASHHVTARNTPSLDWESASQYVAHSARANSPT